MRLVLLLWPLLIFPVGCSACEFPFDFTQEGSFAVPLGAVAGCVGTGGGSLPIDGQPNEEGDLVTWHHVRDGDTCTLTATWTGPLLDMAPVRDEVDREIARRGLDPSHIEVEIVGVEPSLRMVELTDEAADVPLPTGVLLGYEGTLDVGSAAEVLTFRHAPPGDPSQPELDVKETDELLAQINAAWDARSVLPGRGSTTVAVSLEDTSPWSLAQLPVMLASYALHVDGRAFTE